MPAVSLDVVDAAELGELLQFLDAWLAAGHDQVDASWGRFAGHPAYGLGSAANWVFRGTAEASSQARGLALA